MNKVAITGIGIVSCLGTSKDMVTTSLMEGRSGIVFDQKRADLGFRSPLTARIEPIEPKRWGLTRKNIRTMCEPALYSCGAAIDAVKDSALSKELIQNTRCGIIFGNDSTIKAGVEAIETMRRHNETRYIGAGHIFRAMNSTITMNLAAFFGTQGASWTISAACASGAHVIGQALMLIRSGLQDIVIAGGAQELNWMGMASFDALKAFSMRTDQPEAASRPFDRDRDGLVPGGGGAAVIVENFEHAVKRGAKIYCIVEGYGFSSGVGANLSEPKAKCSEQAMINAIKDAEQTPDSMDYVNAHATSTPSGDLAEARAIHQVFGEKIPVSSTKSMTGHECWMSGVSEIIYSILMANNHFIAPNINFKILGDDCPRINVVESAREINMRRSISNSFGFGGTNASIVLNYQNF